MPRLLPTALAVVLVVTSSFAQVTANVGPANAPVGSTILVSIANDTLLTQFSTVCPFSVRDFLGNTVYAPFCILIVQPIQPLAVATYSWDQRDDFGNQVPQGNYFVDVAVPGSGIVTFPITIGTAQAGMVEVGVLRPGRTRQVFVTAPFQGSLTYLAAASLSPIPGITTCAGIVPLAQDAVFTLSTTPGNGIFGNMIGTLGAGGDGLGPTITVPPLPQLSGFSFVMACVTYDFALPNCGVTAVSSAAIMTIN